MRYLMVAVLLASCFSTQAVASDYDEASWRATVKMGQDTLNFWVDPGIYDRAQNGFMKWDDSQSAARSACMNCAPNNWGAQEYWQYQMNLMTKEQNPRYLSDLTYFFVNVERRGSSAGSAYYRTTDADSVVVETNDSGRYTSEPPKDLVVSPAVSRKGEGFEMTCRQLELQLAGQPLYTKSQIESHRHELAYREARYNEFIVIFKIKDPPKNLMNRVKGIRLYYNGQPIDLVRNGQSLVGAR